MVHAQNDIPRDIDLMSAAKKPNGLFWLVGALLLVWGLIGISFYLYEVTLSDEKYLEGYGQAMLDIRHRVPAWSMSGYAIGVWAGLVGTICLLLRRRMAQPLYIISFLGAVAGWGWYLIDGPGRKSLENGGWVMLAVVITLCLFSIWWARRKIADGTLR